MTFTTKMPTSHLPKVFQVDTEPLLHRSIVIDSSDKERANLCLDMLSAHPERAIMVQNLKVMMISPDRNLVDKILACAELMKGLKHLDLKIGLDPNWDDYLVRTLVRWLIYDGEYQLTSLLYHPSEDPKVYDMALTDRHKALEVVGFWYIPRTTPKGLLRFLQLILSCRAGKLCESQALEPYCPGGIGEAGSRLPSIYGIMDLDGLSWSEVGIFPGLYAAEEQRLALCPRVATQLDTLHKDGLRVTSLSLHWFGLTNNESSVAELEPFAESMAAAFPAIRVLRIFTRPPRPADKMDCYTRLGAGLAPLAKTPMWRVDVLPWGDSDKEDGSRLTPAERSMVSEQWRRTFPNLQKFDVFGQSVHTSL
ncbi:hypothetical protein CC2G_012098 [Coprinopsis cinerea AmutBmut pab1-1]|nr:hypothetical protein CC2G_012098 [Coprinopsis cinerea AmutBmut pab1-1]